MNQTGTYENRINTRVPLETSVKHTIDGNSWHDGRSRDISSGGMLLQSKVPANEGETVHIICEVTDRGEPPLTRYRRVIVNVIP